mmetsp:Transcript_42692/g.76788  ORF Transcript_42692/g.76788 Transcript_42692/m.76788 type:complete len:218 (+) Transcript_42692:1-654(+)
MAVAEHRGSGQGGRFPAALHDVKAAVRHLRGHADELGIDPQKLCSYGASSGGWMSLMLATTGSMKEKPAIDLEGSLGDAAFHALPTHVNCSVACFPPTDFLLMDSQAPEGYQEIWHDEPNSPESRFMGFPIQTQPEKCAQASPLSYMHKNMPPVLLLHGDIDGKVPVGQSRIFAEKLREMGLEHEFQELPGAGHGGPGFNQPDVRDRILRFVKKHCP